MRSLDEICQSTHTDKASVHMRPDDPVNHGHGYAPFYDRFFSTVRDKKIKLLEIGVGGGESISAWVEYFENGKIYGVDTVHDTNPFNTVSLNRDGANYTFVNGDQSSETFWRCFIADYGKDWDIIVDDGGHYANQISTTWNELWPHVVPGGLYCIEDLGVDCAGSVFRVKGYPNHMDFINERMIGINRGSSMAYLYYAKELAIMQKAA